MNSQLTKEAKEPPIDTKSLSASVSLFFLSIVSSVPIYFMREMGSEDFKHHILFISFVLFSFLGLIDFLLALYRIRRAPDQKEVFYFYIFGFLVCCENLVYWWISKGSQYLTAGWI
jgi:hypothetical protein